MNALKFMYVNIEIVPKSSYYCYFFSMHFCNMLYVLMCCFDVINISGKTQLRCL